MKPAHTRREDRRPHRLRRSWFGVCLAAAACQEAGPSAMEELVGELRALRMQQARSYGNANGSQARVDAATTAVASLPAAALAPLRQALGELLATQRQLQERQLALTQEMQRWSQLVVDSVAQEHVADGKALADRLAQLEAAQKSQDSRHQQVEQMLTSALDHTAERLEHFLRQIAPPGSGSPQPVPQPLRGETGRSQVDRSPPERSEAERLVSEPGDAAVSRTASLLPEKASSRRGGAERIGWFALSALALGAGCWFLMLARRLPPSSMATQPTAEWPPLVPPSTEVLPTAPTTAPPPTTAIALAPTLSAPATEADDLWRAAAMLGEVVGRLKHSSPPALEVAPAPAAPPPAPEPAAGGDPVAPVAARPEALAAPTPQPPPAPTDLSVAPKPSGRPQAFSCRLRPRDLDAALQALPGLLAQDARVLRWPAPTVLRAGDAIEVSFLLVPHVPAGERGQIEQLLRDGLG
jgi:hypothetical protein